MHIFALLFVLSGCATPPTTGTSCPTGFQDAGDGSCQPVAAPPVATDGQGGGSSPTSGGAGTGGDIDDLILLCIAYVEALDACVLEAFDYPLGTLPEETCAIFEDATGTDTGHNLDAFHCYMAVLADADCSSVEKYETMVQRLGMECSPLDIDTSYDDYGDSGW